MRKTFLCLLAVTLTLVPAGFAQNPVPPPPPNMPRPPIRQDKPSDAGELLDGNYLLTLVLKDKETDVWELSVVTATRSFNISAAQPSNTFAGRILPQENDAFLMDYQFAREVVVPSGGGVSSYRTAATKASVLLRLGVPVQIIKDGSQSFTLKLERCKP